jgi:hypothetical protein
VLPGNPGPPGQVIKAENRDGDDGGAGQEGQEKGRLFHPRFLFELFDYITANPGLQARPSAAPVFRHVLQNDGCGAHAELTKSFFALE